MTMSPWDLRHLVAMVCDAGPDVGVGHVMRCLALGEELVARGVRVVMVANLDRVPWAAEQVRRRGIESVAPGPGDVLDVLVRLEPTSVVVDSYLLPASVYALVRDRWPLLALTDGDPRGRAADLYLDQNLGAETSAWELAAGSQHLGGLTYAQQRRDIVRQRPSAPKTAREEHTPLRVLAFFGGTDAFGVSPRVARLVAETGVPVELTVIVATPELAESVSAVAPAPGQVIDMIGPTDTLAELVADADVVLSAAGTSAWELFCLGAAVGFVCVADNQQDAYVRMDEDGLAVGIATLAELDADPEDALAQLAALLGDVRLRERLRAACWATVDGRGPARVADALLALELDRV
ncbi:spore coat protein [Nocardioides sp. KC13]|uniref:Spore coat protein n=1 Tax=Nocardioides turkmenicus TaxID=2711220 RepID=A0A6M1QUZ5_9ACTN|nr:spore coat protein [Nocardioides sp. KC13]NGN91656.1 spore coat protein [Nocardioides sp. KC13]